MTKEELTHLCRNSTDNTGLMFCFCFRRYSNSEIDCRFCNNKSCSAIRIEEAYRKRPHNATWDDKSITLPDNRMMDDYKLCNECYYDIALRKD